MAKKISRKKVKRLIKSLVLVRDKVEEHRYILIREYQAKINVLEELLVK